MFRAITHDIEVRVTPVYREDESNPDAGRWFWAYTVEIFNGGSRAVQLLSRRWVITDANGTVQEVEGAGVVGMQPMIAVDERFEYTSGCPLPTSSGFMQGEYHMVDEAGEAFDVVIPAFALDLPNVIRILN
ncbi:CO2+/MG2+ efflux protein ApaG [Hartmannibacter diazotrophicus]|uniref:Protein ApaG n=1 Tax=Hartmannibacter diazotrophicus TaxID=1482074 RepID=A0A2C9D3T7_9HYPH|nr:Co2+/Mg2+ efflux protein ApaG [Hartmannibacter diazotrophicus]SON54125.1 CO2+/MG2+ efflux protein ApaG [Hartmannibacter diazotrophicus]